MLARDRRGTRRPPRRDADRVQVAGPRGRQICRGRTLVYAYEEAIGHCVDPSAVRDKDGISAAVLACDLVAALREQGRTVLDALDDLARRTACTPHPVSRPVADADEAAEVMTRLRPTRRRRLCGFDVDDDRSGGGQPTSAHRCGDPRGRRRRTSVRVVGAAVGHRAEGQVLHRGSAVVPRRRGPRCRPRPRPSGCQDELAERRRQW